MLKEKDPSFLVEKLTTLLMKDGKKAKIRVLLNKVFLELTNNGHSAELTLLLALNNVKPLVENRKTKIRGKSFLVPFPLTMKRQLSLALRLLITASKVQKKLSIKKLANEIILASKNEGDAVKRTAEIHLVARQNRIYSHYRWY
jgi:small subunit ribosomal protein S7